MKDAKLLLAFAAGVVITLALCGKIPAVSGFNLPGWLLGGGVLRSLSLIALILVAAFLAAESAGQSAQGSPGSHGGLSGFFQFLKSFRRSGTDYEVSGVCGGLGEKTRVPAWVWRLGFAVAIMNYSWVFLAYLLLSIFLPLDDAKEQPSA